MAGKRKRSNGTWEYVFKKAGVLDKPLYMTFDTEEEGDAYAARMDALLKRGIAPTDLTAEVKANTLYEMISAYIGQAHPSEVDLGCLNQLVSVRGPTLLSAINVAWVDSWIREMKLVDHNAPGTIRKKVGALSRACDWAVRKGLMTMPDMPFKTLPNGYSQYTDEDERIAGEKREDIERDRRLEDGEHEKILAVLESGKLTRKVKDRELPYPKALRVLYILALESAMRLREMYSLRESQIDLKRKTVFLDKTKNGSKRQVPLSSVALYELQVYLRNDRVIPDGVPTDMVFPWWNGDTEELRATSSMIGKLFADSRNPGVFDIAECHDLFFHDLRHEATSRLFERTTLSETQIMKITGHKSQKMLLRYANLRASDLAERLW